MSQYDAGPGDRSDRPWDDPERKPRPQARRRRFTLPPWALLALLVGVVIILCVSLVLIIRAIRGEGDRETPTPPAAATAEVLPSPTGPALPATVAVTATNTVVLPESTPEETPPPTTIGPGASVIVKDTQGAGLNLRTEPSKQADLVGNAPDGAVLTVLEGPRDADGFTWWKVRTSSGTEGWGAGQWLFLQTEE